MKQHIVVVGGSLAGLISALALARDGHRVTIVERDAAPLPETAEGAFDTWKRSGAPQIWQSHALLGRLYGLIRDREPALLDKLLASGAEELTFQAQASQYFGEPEFEPGDDDIVLLACRRTTFEWVLRRHILDTGLLDFRDGLEAVGLVAERGSQPPRITGVRVRAGRGPVEEIAADLVVTASGRRSQLSEWLVEAGAAAPREDLQECGIFYSSRFYRLNEGAERPNQDGIIGGDLGYLKFGIFPADARTFSITLAAAPDDTPLRAILRDRGFAAAERALPMVREWVDPAVATPLTEARGMARLENKRVHLIEDGEPIVIGLVAVGDALLHVNPITGRGCTLAWLAAYALADALRENSDDQRQLMFAFESAVERDLQPWFDTQIAQDRDAVEVNRAQRRGEDPYRVVRDDGTNDPKAYMRSVLREGLLPAMREDLVLLRKFMRVGHMLEVPANLLAQPEVMQRALLAYERRHERPPRVTGPSRDEMVAKLEATGAG